MGNGRNGQFNLSPLWSRRVGSNFGAYSVNGSPIIGIKVGVRFVINPRSVAIEIKMPFIETCLSYANDTLFWYLGFPKYQLIFNFGIHSQFSELILELKNAYFHLIFVNVLKSIFLTISVPNLLIFTSVIQKIWCHKISVLGKLSKITRFYPNFGCSRISKLTNFEFRNWYWNSISEFWNLISELETLLVPCRADRHNHHGGKHPAASKLQRVVLSPIQ